MLPKSLKTHQNNPARFSIITRSVLYIIPYLFSLILLLLTDLTPSAFKKLSSWIRLWPFNGMDGNYLYFEQNLEALLFKDVLILEIFTVMQDYLGLFKFGLSINRLKVLTSFGFKHHRRCKLNSKTFIYKMKKWNWKLRIHSKSQVPYLHFNSSSMNF